MNYKKIHDSIILRAKTRIIDGYVEKHHIIPRSMGGSDENDNIAILTPEEHFLIHVLLVKIYPNQKSLIVAVLKMTQPISGRKKRKLYGWLKRKYSVYRKDATIGNKNPQYGKFWITNGSVSKVISDSEKNSYLSNGWNLGRVIKPKKCFRETCTNFILNKNSKYCNDCKGSRIQKIKKEKEIVQFTINSTKKIREEIRKTVPLTNRGFRKKLSDNDILIALQNNNFEILASIISLGYKRGGNTLNRFKRIRDKYSLQSDLNMV